MKDTRPVNLNLTTLKFPIMAIVSILHRVSGVLIFFAIPFMLCGLQKSLASAQSFKQLHLMMLNPLVNLFVWGILVLVLYHFIAGIRHLMMDHGWGESLACARMSAILVFVLTILTIVLTGVWLWL